MARDLAAVWRRVFEGHASGAGTMAALCERHGVSKGAWYTWRQRVGKAGLRPLSPLRAVTEFAISGRPNDFVWAANSAPSLSLTVR